MTDPQPQTPALMFQGTGSDVGKSLLVAGLCRLLQNKGRVVFPFKPQNMSNNAAVTTDGGEIGRAQALQALAARQKPLTAMNPVLLKPQTDTGAQVVVRGKVLTSATAREYHALKPTLLSAVVQAFEEISQQADMVLVEGAGSPAEVNLRTSDIANMGFAEAVDIPVLLVADIDRGGVIASIVGTWNLISDSERSRLKGYIINKFRGDPGLFQPAIDIIKEQTGLDCLGVLPWFNDAASLPKEDGMALDRSLNRQRPDKTQSQIKIGVPKLSRIANFDDLDPLSNEPMVKVIMVEPGQAFPGDLDIILIPGSKSTRGDLAFMKEQGWDIDILAHHRRGGIVVGLCGGFQMLGQIVSDPTGIEGNAGTDPGLGLLDIKTDIMGDKTLETITATDQMTGKTVQAYEMHIGKTSGAGLDKPWFVKEDGSPEGAISQDGRVYGSYCHGVFTEDGFRKAFLDRLHKGTITAMAYQQQVDQTLDNLADHMERHLDLDKLLGLLAPTG